MEAQERILLKAEELFMRYGVRTITMDDIARELAMSKKTIYQYFKDKDELVYQISLKSFEDDQCHLKEIKENSNNALEEVMMISKHIKKDLSEINPSVFFDVQRYHPRAWAIWEHHKKGFVIETVKDNLKRGIEDGLYRTDINIEALANLRVLETHIAFDSTIFPPDKFNLVELQLEFLEHFVRGIVTSKGAEVWQALHKDTQNEKYTIF